MKLMKLRKDWRKFNSKGELMRNSLGKYLD